MDGVGHAEGAVAVAAGSDDADAVAVAADRLVDDAEAAAVDGDEVVDPALELVIDEVPNAAEVTGSFFADGADEEDGAWSSDVGVVQGLGDGEEDGESAAVVDYPGAFERVADVFDGDVGLN